jgi:hypothetical protein
MRESYHLTLLHREEQLHFHQGWYTATPCPYSSLQNILPMDGSFEEIPKLVVQSSERIDLT